MKEKRIPSPPPQRALTYSGNSEEITVPGVNGALKWWMDRDGLNQASCLISRTV